MHRVVTYVDGYNLYFGLRQRQWRYFYWLNVQEMATNLLRPNQSLVYTHYFTTVVKQPDDKRKRQAAFLDALRTLANFDIHFGHFLSDTVTCHYCGHSHLTHHEKMTDVNIAVQMLCDAFQNRFDTALLVSADSDLVGPVEAIKSLFPTKRVVVAFPPKRSSKQLQQTAHAFTHIGRDVLAQSVFPDEIETAGGFLLRRPEQWK